MHTLTELFMRGEDSTTPQNHSYVCFEAVATTNPQISNRKAHNRTLGLLSHPSCPSGGGDARLDTRVLDRLFLMQ
jgi:hypothetical protein